MPNNIKRKRKSPVAKTLVKNGCAALMAAIEIHNKPIFEYRYEVCTLLVINAWELVIKALIYKCWKDVPLEDEGQPRPFRKCLNDVASRLSGDEHRSFRPIKESLANLYKYRNSIAHFHTEELDVILFSLLRASVIDFADFVKSHFDCEVCPGPTVLLPIHVSGDFNPVEFLIKQPAHSDASSEVRDFINGLFESCQRLQQEGIEDSIFSTWEVELVSTKKASNDTILAARANTALDATPVEITNRLGEVRISNSPNAVAVHLSEEEFLKLYSETYKSVWQKAQQLFTDFKCNQKFNDLMKLIKTNPNLCGRHLHNPQKPDGAATTLYSENVYDEIAKHYTRRSL